MIKLADIKSTPFALKRAFKFVLDELVGIKKRLDALENGGVDQKVKNKNTKKDKEI